MTNSTFAHVLLTDVIPGNNIRSALPDVEELVESIKKVGVQTPVSVSRHMDGKLHLIAGYRRYFASKLAGVETIPVVIQEAQNITSEVELALIENIQRVDMNAMDRALAIKTLVDEAKNQKEVAERLGKTDGYVSQHLAFLRLPRQAQQYLATDRIDSARARQLVRLNDDESVMELLEKATMMTSTELQQHVDLMLKLQEDASNAKEEDKSEDKISEKETDKPAKKIVPKSTLVEQYRAATITIKPVDDLRNLMIAYAEKLNGSRSVDKQSEYKNILKGMELAAGVELKKK